MRVIRIFLAILITTFHIGDCFAQYHRHFVDKDSAVAFAQRWVSHFEDGDKYYVGDVVAQMKDTIPLMYIVNLSPQGWLIVSSDKRLSPVLAYSRYGNIDINNVNPAAKIMLQRYSNEIDSFLKSTFQALREHESWKSVIRGTKQDVNSRSMYYDPGCRLLDKGDDGYVSWNQSYPYNAQCPIVNGVRTPVGCGAVALGQVLWYWQWPYTAMVSDTVGAYTTHRAFFDWDHMPFRITYMDSLRYITEISSLLRDCGYSLNMQYTPSVSYCYLSDIQNALLYKFQYSATMWYAYNMTDSVLLSKIHAEIDLGRIVIYRGANASNEGGHFFLFDGYDQNDSTLIHVNWGWSSWDGFYRLSSLTPGNSNFNYYHYMLTDIYPRCYQKPNKLCIDMPIERPIDLRLEATDSIIITAQPAYSNFNIQVNSDNVKLGRDFIVPQGSSFKISQTPFYQLCEGHGKELE